MYHRFNYTLRPICPSQQLNHFCHQFVKTNAEFHVSLLFILRMHREASRKMNGFIVTVDGRYLNEGMANQGGRGKRFTGPSPRAAAWEQDRNGSGDDITLVGHHDASDPDVALLASIDRKLVAMKKAAMSGREWRRLVLVDAASKEELREMGRHHLSEAF